MEVFNPRRNCICYSGRADNRRTAVTLGVKWFETPQASRHHGNLRFPYDPEALGLLRL